MFIKSRQVLFGLLAISLGALAINSKKIYCGLRGHDEFMEFEPNKLYLYCPNCHYKTHGWQLDSPKYKVSK